jgi:hypothetical protein
MNALVLTLPSRFLALILIIAPAAATHAGVTNLVWYRLGENDPGAATGLAVTNTTADLAGGGPLTQFNGPRYTNGLFSGAPDGFSSSLAISFNGINQFLSNSVVLSGTDGFALEVWVKPNQTTNSVSNAIVYNGAFLNGYGFYGNRPNYTVLFSGRTNLTLGPATAGIRAHLALARDGGTKLYFNGIAVATNTTSPIFPNGDFEVGHGLGDLLAGYFDGVIDEVRVFTFAPGQFNPNDLLINLKRVTTRPANGFTLNGDVNPAGLAASAWFEFGTTTNYGAATPSQSFIAGTGATNFSQPLGGVIEGVTYQFRAVMSNTLGLAFGTNQSFTVPRLTFAPLTDFGGGDGWLAPFETSSPYLATGNNERGLAYGNGHLYLVSHANVSNTTANIRILDPATGADLGGLNNTGISGGIFLVNSIAVGGDGVIYVGNLTTQSSSLPYTIYAWTNETAVPVVVYSGDGGLAGSRIGDDLAAIGSGSSTRLVAGYNNVPHLAGDNGYAIINPAAGTATAVIFPTPPNSGDFRLGITFYDASHVIGTAGGSLYRYTSFAGAAGTLIASPQIPDPAGATADRLLAVAVVGGLPLLAVQSIGDSHVSIYDVTDPLAPDWLASGNNTSGFVSPNSNGTGELAWGDIAGNSAKLYAMSSNQGIQAFLVTVASPRPKLTLRHAADKVVLAWPTNAIGFSLEAATNLSPTIVWTSASPPPVVMGTNYVVTNSIAGNARFYRLKP